MEQTLHKNCSSAEKNPDIRKKWVPNAGQIIKSNSLKLPNETYILILGSMGEGKTGKDPFVIYHAFVFDNLGNVKEEFHSSTIPMRIS